MKRWIVYCDSDNDADGYKRGDMVSETGDAKHLAPATALKARGRKVVEVAITDPDAHELRTGRVNYGIRQWDAKTKTLVRKPAEA